MSTLAKSVTLPKHLWSALDDMARDGTQGADDLVAIAVEQFVALQGYDVPAPAAGTAQQPSPSAPASLQDDDEEPLEYARTQARPALTPSSPPPETPKPVEAAPVVTDMGPAHKPSEPPVVTGLAPTHVPSSKASQSKQMPVYESPPKGKSVTSLPSPPPTWAKRAARTDDEEERASARERMAALDQEVERFTVARATTTPLGDEE
jgi:hypothetical protein